MVINVEAAQELLGPGSRDAGIGGLHDLPETFFPKSEGSYWRRLL